MQHRSRGLLARVTLATVTFGLWLLPTMTRGQIPAFPGAEGYGAYARGGRGGDVYHVTNLNASGVGSFLDAIATVPSAGRTIVFDVSGYIRFPSGSGGTRMTASKVTIAGQTAPGDGIGFYNNAFRISGDDVIIRHLRFRLGKYGTGGDCLNLDSGSINSILDHLSVQFSTDENISSFSSPPENLTLQYSLNAWGLESHSCGGLWDQNHATSHHNLWAHNHTRNPKARPNGLLEWVNNVTFDWDIGFIMGDSQSNQNWKSNIINNYFVSPPGNIPSKAMVKGTVGDNGKPNFTIFYSGNLIDRDATTGLDNAALTSSHIEGTPYPAGTSGLTPGAAAYYLAAGAIDRSTGTTQPGLPVTTDSPLLAYKKIVSNAGALRLDASFTGTLRDEVDTILFSKLVNQQKFHVTRESDTGAGASGFGVLKSTAAPADTDKDGMPDFYETALGWNVAVQDHNTALANSGGFITGTTFLPPGTTVGSGTLDKYTRLEEYLHFLAIPHATVAKSVSGAPTSVVLDLRKFTSGFPGSPTFIVSNVTPAGSVALSGPGNAIATFAPPENYTGRGRFDFTVTDSAGTSWTQTFAILVANSGLPRDLVWNGAGNTWDAAAVNWFRPATSTNVAFSASDRVTLDQSGIAQPNVNASSTIQPGSITVDATGNYTLSGPGAIASTGELIKRGSGTLALSNTGPNSFSAVSVDEGQLSLGNFGAAGTGKMSLNGGSLHLASGTANPLEFNAPTTISVGSQHTMTGNWTGTQEVTVTGPSSYLWSLSGTWTGFTGSIKLGAGNVRIRLNGSTSNTMFGSPLVAIDLGSGSSQLMNRNGGTFDIGALEAAGTSTQLQGLQTAPASGTPPASTYNIGNLNRDSIFAGIITNGASNVDGPGVTNITKVGTGTLRLNGASTYTGTTMVGGGQLAVDGSLGNTPVSVQSGTILSGLGPIANTLTVASGGSLSPGGNGGAAAGILTVNGLAATTPTYRYDLTGNPAGANDKIVVANNGTLAITGNQHFLLNFVDGVLGAGTYTLVDNIGTGPLTASSPTLTSNLPSGTRQTFQMNRNGSGTVGGDIWLTVTGNPATLAWSGAGAWDSTSTASWSGAADAKFYNFDAVTFDDSASTGAVSISSAVQPRSIALSNSSKNFTFSGVGSLGGTGSLTKSGSGTLTIAPDYLTLATTTTSGSATVTVASTAGLVPGMAVGGTGIPAGTTIAVVVDGTTLTLSQNATANGPGVGLGYFAAHTYGGGTIIHSGSTIMLGNAAANVAGLGTGAVTFNGGTLKMFDSTNFPPSGVSDSSSWGLVVPAGQTGTFNTDSRSSLYGSLTGSGTLNLFIPWIRTDFNGNWSAFSGVINLTTNGVLTSGDDKGRFRIATNYSPAGLPLAAVNLGDKTTVEFTGIISAGAGTTISIGELSGTSSSLLLGGPSSSGARLLTHRIGGRGTSATFAGSILEQDAAVTNTSIVKTGGGIWTLSGVSTYNGGTTVEQGTLRLSGSITSGSTLNVSTGATFDLPGGSVTVDAVNIAPGAFLTGNGIATITGDFNNDGSATISGGTFKVTGSVVNNATMRLKNSSVLNATGAFVNNGLLDLLTSGGGLPQNFENNGVVVDSGGLKVVDSKLNGADFELTIVTYSGHTYRFQCSETMQPGSWIPIGSPVVGDGSQKTFVHPGGSAGTSRYFRVAVD